MKILTIKRFILGPGFTNTYLIWDKNHKIGLIIDPADETELLLKYIEKESINLKYIVLTHGHFDHVGAADGLQKKTRAKIIINKKELETLKSVPLQARLFGLQAPKIPTPDIFVGDGDMIGEDKLTFRIIETPGHSPGSISLYNEKETIIFSGDTLFKRSIGRTDLPGGNFQILIKSIKEKLLTLPGNVKVYPGHEEPTTVEEERKFNPFLQKGGYL